MEQEEYLISLLGLTKHCGIPDFFIESQEAGGEIQVLLSTSSEKSFLSHNFGCSFMHSSRWTSCSKSWESPVGLCPTGEGIACAGVTLGSWLHALLEAAGPCCSLTSTTTKDTEGKMYETSGGGDTKHHMQQDEFCNCRIYVYILWCLQLGKWRNGT